MHTMWKMKEKLDKHQTLSSLEPVTRIYTVQTKDGPKQVNRRYDSKLIKMRSYTPSAAVAASDMTSKYKWISLDPGVRSFLTGWSPEGIVYYFGQNCTQLYNLNRTMTSFQSDIDNRINSLIHEGMPEFTIIEGQDKAGQKIDYRVKYAMALKDRRVQIKHQSKTDQVILDLTSKINSKRRQIDKLVNQIHEESSSFLVNEFDLIIIPEFGKGNSGKGSPTSKSIMSYLAHGKFIETLKCKEFILVLY